MVEVGVALLGPLSLFVDDVEVAVPSAKQAGILSVLAVESGHAVAADRLIEIVWGVEPDDRADHALQQHVSSLRKLLEPSRAPRAEPVVLLTRRHGYELVARVDVAEFELLASEAVDCSAVHDHERAVAACDRALACWRGPALADMRTSSWADAVAARLEERRLSLCELRAEALLALGRHVEVVPELEALLDSNPFRERSWGQLMVALYRSGRQADAVAAFARARNALVEQLGLDPGPELRALEQRILDQDPTLAVAQAESLLADVAIAETYRPGVVGVPLVELPDGQVVRLSDGTNCIGRVPEAEIRLSDSRVSRRHAEIHWADGVAVVRDLDSTNGTTVDGRRVDGGGAELGDGAELSIGGVGLRYRLSI